MRFLRSYLRRVCSACKGGRCLLRAGVLCGLGLAWALVAASPAHAFCFAQAAQRYGVNEALLRAIAKVESNNQAQALSPNKVFPQDCQSTAIQAPIGADKVTSHK